MKTKIRLAMLFAALPVIIFGFATESFAKRTCVFQGIGAGNKVAQGVGTHRKKLTTACKRARKKCRKALNKMNGRPL